MGTNGREISCERFPKNPEERQNPQSEPLKPKFHSTQISEIMVRKFPEKISRKSGSCWEENHSTESSRNSGMKIEWNGNFQEIGSSFSEILQIRDLLFSASFFGRDHSELNISRKDDGDAYSKMETL